MKMRPPAVPLITIDPYFSVWSASDKLYESTTVHWTDSPNPITGKIIVDGNVYRFMGEGSEDTIPQVSMELGALYTEYKFANDYVLLNLEFFTPLFADDLYRLSRPVSYARINYCSLDGKTHNVNVVFEVSEEIAMDKKGDSSVCTEIIISEKTISGKLGCSDQKVLSRSGDDLRIEWGYFYLSAGKQGSIQFNTVNCVTSVKLSLDLAEACDEFVLFSYDDIYCLNYFGKPVEAYWKKINSDIIINIENAFSEAAVMQASCRKYSNELYNSASLCGGENYAELLSLAYRQVIASHKLAVDENNENVFISKECFSNGCAATVDVTYPSSPFFLLYNTELLKGMLRPVFKFAASDEWTFDFAPHDVGQYPLLLGQVYGKNHEKDGKYRDYQMPVEECGNMLIMLANICLKDKNTEFFDKYDKITSTWVEYLIEYGMDPENQLCTDDFAGHLAHNCNLSLKAIMGIEGYSLILKMKNDVSSEKYHIIAQNMAENWVKKACNDDGSFRLTFDRPGTYSMKYNMIWDKIWKTGLFPPYIYNSEFSSNLKHVNSYGMPLDNRKTYTKSDWLVWTACLSSTKKDFEDFIYPLWLSYHVSPSRVPMTDWYDTVSSHMVGFRHRSVQGGLFIRMMFKD